MNVDRDTCDLLCLDLPKAECLREALPALEQLEAWAAGAKALGDPTRLAIALALRDGKMVMYELTARGRALLTAIAAEKARA